jgi:ABC-2 type transport system permease protein
MNKYLSISKISFHQEFAYKFNFVMWRVRNVIQILVFFFLWNSILEGRTEMLFGYNKAKILTYAILLIFVRAITLSSRSIDVAGQISNGDLSNLMLKPVNFFKYWITRDISSKFLNVIFSIVEISAFFLILRPPFFIQTNLVYLVSFVVSIAIAIFIYFNLLMLTNFVPFWFPEVAWGAQFLVIMVVIEFLSGAVFPIDVFPENIYKIMTFTPFPYIIFFPIKIYLGLLSFKDLIICLGIGGVWSYSLWLITNRVFKKGLEVYEASGR